MKITEGKTRGNLKEKPDTVRPAPPSACPTNKATDEGLPDNNPKTAFGVKKPSLGLVPSPALIQLAMAMQLGSDKYGPYNWRANAVSSMVYVNAAERHLRSWLDGEDLEPESGASHLAHVMACCAILLDALAVGNLIDNRPLPAPTAELIKFFTREN